VRDCDRIFLMDRGRVAAQGTYQELLATSETFRAMAHATSQTEEKLRRVDLSI
jgi:ABC-type multidrug transport system fused ATPase/permease subunit